MTMRKYSNCSHKHSCYSKHCHHYHKHTKEANPIKRFLVTDKEAHKMMTKNEGIRRWNAILKHYGKGIHSREERLRKIQK